jgi:1,4-alpha-glucan branching enzyme
VTGLRLVLEGRTLPALSLSFRFAGGGVWEQDDPYRFLPSSAKVDIYLSPRSTTRPLAQSRAHPRQPRRVDGTGFAVLGPERPRRQRGGRFQPRGTSGACPCGGWAPRECSSSSCRASRRCALQVPHPGPSRELRLKADPFARAAELPPGHGVAGHRLLVPVGRRRVAGSAARGRDPAARPMAIYEVHLGSWARILEEGHTLADLPGDRAAPHRARRRLGFTHVEFLPLAEHPFTGSWGVSGAAPTSRPTARYGTRTTCAF